MMDEGVGYVKLFRAYCITPKIWLPQYINTRLHDAALIRLRCLSLFRFTTRDVTCEQLCRLVASDQISLFASWLPSDCTD
jgi:hypothetical protein